MLSYWTQLFCGSCDHSLCVSTFSGLLLLRGVNILLLGFTNSKAKNPFLQQKIQKIFVSLGVLDALCALIPLILLLLIGSHASLDNFPIVHVSDSFLAISAALMNRDLIRSTRISFYGLLSSLIISLLTFPLYVYLVITLAPDFMNSSAYEQSLVIICLFRMIFSLIFSATFSYLLFQLIGSAHEPSYRSLSNSSSSNNIDLVNLGFEWTLNVDSHQWEPSPFAADPELEELDERAVHEEVEEEPYETYYQYLLITVISSVFEKASNSKFSGVGDMPPLASDARCHEQINFLSPAICAHFSGKSSLEPKASHLFLLIFSRYSSEFLLTGYLVFFKSILQFIGPIMLQQLVLSAQQNKPWSKISIQIFILFLSRFCCSFLDTHYHLLSQNLSIKISGALKGSLFRKIISLSSTSRLKFTIGNLTNLYTVDIDRIAEVMNEVHNFWSLPLQVSSPRPCSLPHQHSQYCPRLRSRCCYCIGWSHMQCSLG